MSDSTNGRLAPAWDAMFVFAADGRLLASSTGDGGPLQPPIDDLADLQSRFRQSDGMPIDLARRTRIVGVPRSPGGIRVMLSSEPVTGIDAGGEGPALTVAVAPFRDEEDAQTMQRALGSVLAHELRTPMTTIYGGADLLTGRGLSETGRTEAAKAVGAAAEQLHRVVEDLVLLVRWSGESAGDPEPVLLPPLVRAAAERASARGVPVLIDAPPTVPPVAGTEPLLEHLLRDLLDHAVANTPPGGHVRLAVRGRDGSVEITIDDDGPARDADELGRAFDLFASSARQAADPSGANLPMVAARRLVRRLEGEIKAVAVERGGRVVVRLPAAV